MTDKYPVEHALELAGRWDNILHPEYSGVVVISQRDLQSMVNLLILFSETLTSVKSSLESEEYYEEKPHKAARDLEWVRDKLYRMDENYGV